MTLLFEDKDLATPQYDDDSHPLFLYLHGTVQLRSDIILNHPDVTGFVYLHDDVITKAFLPKKIINFKSTSEDRNNIAAVSGDTDDYTPFLVPEKNLFSDALHITDCTELNKATPAIALAKFLKECGKDQLTLPKEFESDNKTKKLKIVSFPMILPMLTGYNFEEGEIHNESIYDSASKVHDLYADWVFLHSKKYVVPAHFLELTGFPVPNQTCDIITYSSDIPLKVLFKRAYPFTVIKKEVETFILANRKTEVKPPSVPEVIDVIQGKASIASNTNTSEEAVANDRLIAFLQIMFAKPNYDRNGELLSLGPAVISDDLQEILSATTKTSVQSRMMSDSLRVLAEDISQEDSYLSRASKFPFLTNTVLSYAIQAHYHCETIDGDLESLKKSFSVLALLAPPAEDSEEYRGYVNSSKNIEVDRMLDQPEDKRAMMRKDIFIKGNQENLQDVITFIANIVVYTRFWIKLPNNNDSDIPMVIQMLMELADYLSSSEYSKFDDKFNKIAPYMYHTLVSYIFNIFSKFIRMAKNPHVVRRFKIENVIDAKEIKIGQVMFKQLLEQLQLCSATSSLQVLFAQPAISYKRFFPMISQNDKKRQFVEKEKTTENLPKKRKYGSIINKTGKRLLFPHGLEKNYCSNFMDLGEFCKHGDDCKFTHATYPSGFSEHDRAIMEKYVQETDGLAFAKTVSPK